VTAALGGEFETVSAIVGQLVCTNAGSVKEADDRCWSKQCTDVPLSSLLHAKHQRLAAMISPRRTMVDLLWWDLENDACCC
jgi:hypothetical protein